MVCSYLWLTVQLRISCRQLESLQSLALVILHFFTCGKAESSTSKILSEGNVWEHSVCISFVVEVNQNTQETQRQFSDKSSKFYFNCQPQGYELSHLHKEQHTRLQDLDSQLLLVAVSFPRFIWKTMLLLYCVHKVCAPQHILSPLGKDHLQFQLAHEVQWPSFNDPKVVLHLILSKHNPSTSF